MGNGSSKSKSRTNESRGPLTTNGNVVLSALMLENRAYVAGRAKKHDDVPTERARLAAEGQAPAAAVIACADSRVAPEILFRATLGELFVIRAAGNTPWGPEVVGSIEYAVEHLRVPLVLVLGHTKCGAVGAACAGGDPLPGALGAHIAAIARGLNISGSGAPPDVDCAVRQNVRAGIKALREEPGACISGAEKRGVVVQGAVYDIATGKVSLLSEDEDEEMEGNEKSVELMKDAPPMKVEAAKVNV